MGNTDKTKFDWHCDPIDASKPITTYYRNTQNARRFFKAQCGEHFKFNRSFMAWFKENPELTMGDAATEWLRRESDS